jgi:hypothetical protein
MRLNIVIRIRVNGVLEGIEEPEIEDEDDEEYEDDEW